jgi:hypothetical protein
MLALSASWSTCVEQIKQTSMDLQSRVRRKREAGCGDGCGSSVPAADNAHYRHSAQAEREPLCLRHGPAIPG